MSLAISSLTEPELKDEPALKLSENSHSSPGPKRVIASFLATLERAVPTRIYSETSNLLFLRQQPSREQRQLGYTEYSFCLSLERVSSVRRSKTKTIGHFADGLCDLLKTLKLPRARCMRLLALCERTAAGPLVICSL